MEINWGQLVLVIVGTVLGLVATIVANRLAVRNSLLVARDQRLFDLRREAVRGVRDARNATERLHLIERTKANLRTLIELRQKLLEPIMNGRDAFGLDTTGEKVESLTALFFKIFESTEDENKFRLAIGYFVPALYAHADEIQDAWKRTLKPD